MIVSTVSRDVSTDTRTTLSPRLSKIRLASGVRLSYAEQGNRDGVPVILLHGITDSWFSFSPVLPLFDASCRVFALSQRGHGDSARPEGGYAVRDFAADVIAFMDALEIPSAVLVGHSMGSFVAQRVAFEAPQRVRKLVLVGSASTAHNEGVLELLREVEALSDPVPVEFARAFQDSTVYRPLPEDFMQKVTAESLKLPARVWRAAFKGLVEDNDDRRLNSIRVRTLILWGDRDTVFSRSEQEVLISRLPNAALKIYPETGHALHWERPEQFAHDLKQFINGMA